MMAKQICIFDYVIAIILILSNVRIVVSLNKNNQYGTTTTNRIVARTPSTISSSIVSSTQSLRMVTTVTPTIPSSLATIPILPSAMITMRSAEIESINAMNENNDDFMQFETLHNNNQQNHHRRRRPPIVFEESTQLKTTEPDHLTDEYIVQSDAQNPRQQKHQQHQLLSTKQNQVTAVNNSMSNSNRSYTRRTGSNNIAKSATPAHNEFMNENIENKNKNENVPVVGVSMGSSRMDAQGKISNEMENKQRPTHNEQITNHNNVNLTRKIDEIIEMPIETVRDNANGTLPSNRNDFKIQSSDELNSKMIPIIISDRTDRYDDTSGSRFDERSRYLESDLNFNDDELPADINDEQQSNDNINDQLMWPSDANKFEELTLNEEIDGLRTANTENQEWTIDSPTSEAYDRSTKPISNTGNIFKVNKSNKSKSIKRLAIQSAIAPQALLEIRLNRSPPMSDTNAKQFINANSFRYIINLYDQYEWNIDYMRNGLSDKCVTEMDDYLNALRRGATWAAKGK